MAHGETGLAIAAGDGARGPVQGAGGELALLKLRYKQPDAERSQLIQKPLARTLLRGQSSARLRWSAAVAAYADLLRGGTHVGKFGWNDVRALAASAKGEDRWGYRAEFLGLVDRARAVTGGGGEPDLAVSQ